MKDKDFENELHNFLYNEGFNLKSEHDSNYSILPSSDGWMVVDWQGIEKGVYKTIKNAIKKIYKLNS